MTLTPIEHLYKKYVLIRGFRNIYIIWKIMTYFVMKTVEQDRVMGK